MLGTTHQVGEKEEHRQTLPSWVFIVCEKQNNYIINYLITVVIMKDREDWCAVIHRITKNRTQLSD